jgi:hypothetical protein
MVKLPGQDRGILIFADTPEVPIYKAPIVFLLSFGASAFFQTLKSLPKTIALKVVFDFDSSYVVHL